MTSLGSIATEVHLPELWPIIPFAMLLSAIMGGMLARMKRRSDGWVALCFLFPPILLLLMILPRGSATPSNPYSDRYHDPGR